MRNVNKGAIFHALLYTLIHFDMLVFDYTSFVNALLMLFEHFVNALLTLCVCFVNAHFVNILLTVINA